MQEIEALPQIFAVSTLIMLALVGFIIFFVMVYQRRLSKQQLHILQQEALHRNDLLIASVETQEAERERIARDLHDEIGAMLSAIKMKVNQTKRKAKEDELLASSLNETSDLLTESIQNVRRISHGLLPPTLSTFGLASTLKSHLENMENSEGPKLSFIQTGTSKRLSETKELGLYRVAMEMIGNAIKHAKADEIIVKIQFESSQAILLIIDNGKGMDLPESKSASKGLGLKNIESRLLSIEGDWELKSELGKGTSIKICIPYENSRS